ncbi:DUF4167 domain-containing protein [Aquisediminimonas sediminicola]|uniref:DUF4167 domain-containing protein n=1 Tax=Alteraquisediminimonas sediminicola TaxID=2676787 RepID=UPI001C8EEF3D
MINNRQNNNNNNRRRNRSGPRPQGGGGGGGSHRPEQGNRIDNRARGNAPQLLEKYKNLARDAQMQGDRVMTEYYLQFADHYFRVLADNRARFEEQQAQRTQRQDMPAEVEGVAMGVEGEPINLSMGHQQASDEDDGESADDGMMSGDERPRDNRQRDDRPRDDRQRDQRPREYRSRDDRPRDDRPREDRQRVQRPRQDEQREMGDVQAEPFAPAPRPAAARPAARPAPRATPRAVRPVESDEAPARIDMAALPPAINDAVEPTGGEDAPAPRRRGRPRRVVSEVGGDA